MTWAGRDARLGYANTNASLRSRQLVHVGSSLHQNRKQLVVTVEHGDSQGVAPVAVVTGRVCPLVAMKAVSALA